MKKILSFLIILAIGLMAQSLDCSLRPIYQPENAWIIKQARQMDAAINHDYMIYETAQTANEMDSRDVPMFSAEDVLDSYYSNPKAVKVAFSKMKRTRRITLLNEVIDKLSELYGVNHYTIKAIVKQESHYNPKAVSHKGAIGLMQLMPSTAKAMGVRDIENPIDNLIGGIKYVKHLSTMFKMKTQLVLAAYNAGPNAVKKHKGVPPYKETTEYVVKVLEYRKGFRSGSI